MSTVSTTRLVESAHKRHKEVLSRANTALEALIRNGDTVTVSRLASYAKVSRSWIYSQPELRLYISQCQESQDHSASAGPSQKAKATAGSLLHRLQLAHQLITQLRVENKQLRDALARLHGQLREERL